MERWTVWSLDVWGNAADGWDVNDRSKLGTITLPADASNAAVLSALFAAGFSTTANPGAVDIDGDDGWMDVADASNGRPVFTLEREAR